MKSLMLVMTAAILAAGCAPFAQQLNGRNAGLHARAASQAERAGDWPEARRQWELALMDVRLAHANEHDQSAVLYQYGRVLGITCDYAKAEQALQASLALEQKSGHQAHLRLYELALLAERQGKPQQAISYYRALLPLLESRQVAREHPQGVADVYRRYAALLTASGNDALAAQLREKAALVKPNMPAVPEEGREEGRETPYGSACESGA